MSAKRPFIDTPDTAADLGVGSKHDFAVARFKKTEQCLQCLHVTWAKTKLSVRVSESPEDGPDVKFCR